MKYLFSRAGRSALRELARAESLFAFDFDGTLAPITRHPEDAALKPSVANALVALASRASVAIITGRSRVDLRARVPAGLSARCVGNHGLEGAPGAAADAKHLRALVRRWNRTLRTRAFGAGVELEDKGLSLAVHYRKAPDWERARVAIEKAALRLSPPARIIGGKCVVNLVPIHGLNKGTALLRLLEREGRARALYVGDDDTDEDAFALGKSRVLAVRVGITRASKAEFYLKRQSEVVLLLRLLGKLAREGQSFSGRRVLSRTRKSAPPVTI